MRIKSKSLLTRKRLIIAASLFLIAIPAAWFGGRFALARWAVSRILTAAGLQPATFIVTAVEFDGLQIADLSLGTNRWFTASHVDVTFSLSNLLHSRVDTLRVESARWTISSVDGKTDFGYVPASTSTSSPLSLPLNRIDIASSLIHIIIDGVPRDINFSGGIMPAAPGAISANLDLSALGRQTTLNAQLHTDSQKLSADLTGTIPAATSTTTSPFASALANWHATILRDRTTGDTQADLDLTLSSLQHQFGTVAISIPSATLQTHALITSRGLTELSSLLTTGDIQLGPASLHSISLKATKLDNPKFDMEFALDLAAAADTWNLPAVRGTLNWESFSYHGLKSPEPTSRIFSLSLQTAKPVPFNFEPQGITANADSIAASVQFASDKTGMHFTGGDLTLQGGSLQAGDLSLSEARASIISKSPDAIDITSLTAIVGDGGTLSIDPFTWNPSLPHLAAHASVHNLSLEHWLPLITSKHASGEGRMSGDAAFSFDWSSGSLHLDELKGNLHSDPQHGYIQVTDAEAMGDLLDKQDPRFATDELMRPVRDKIVNALKDFSFNKLTVDLSRTDDETVALTYLSGFGRHGDDPQGLNLTLDLHAQDSALNLAARIAAKSQVTKAARDALEEFFQSRAPVPEKR